DRPLTASGWVSTVSLSTKTTTGGHSEYSRHDPQEVGTEQEEPVLVLHQGWLPAAGVRGLQGRGQPEEDVQRPGQALQPQAQWHLRHLPAGPERRGQACPVHGPAPVRRRVVVHSFLTAGPASAGRPLALALLSLAVIDRIGASSAVRVVSWRASTRLLARS